MKKKSFIGMSFLALVMVLGMSVPARSEAGLNISITVPLPRLAIPAPPALVLIPGTYAYVAADIGTDLMFYRGYWYHPYGRQWYRAADYRGPWHIVVRDRVPAVLWRLPGYHRHIHAGYKRHPHRVVMRKWRTWERGQSGEHPKRKPYYKKKYGRHPVAKRYERKQENSHSKAKQRYRKAYDRHPAAKQRYQERHAPKEVFRNNRGRNAVQVGRRFRSN